MKLEFGQKCIVLRQEYGNRLRVFRGTVLDKARIGDVYTVIDTPSHYVNVDGKYIYDLETAAKLIKEFKEKGYEIMAL